MFFFAVCVFVVVVGVLTGRGWGFAEMIPKQVDQTHHRNNPILSPPHPTPPHRQKFKEKEKTKSWNPCYYIGYISTTWKLEGWNPKLLQQGGYLVWLVRIAGSGPRLNNPKTKLELGLISGNWNWNWVKTRITVPELEPNMDGPGSGTGTRIQEPGLTACQLQTQ